jgi:hypothetical protein
LDGLVVCLRELTIRYEMPPLVRRIRVPSEQLLAIISRASRSANTCSLGEGVKGSVSSCIDQGEESEDAPPAALFPLLSRVDKLTGFRADCRTSGIPFALAREKTDERSPYSTLDCLPIGVLSSIGSRGSPRGERRGERRGI